jgi:hypothetical protein
MVPTLPIIMQCIVLVFRASQALAKKCIPREILLERMNTKIELDLKRGKNLGWKCYFCKGCKNP